MYSFKKLFVFILSIFISLSTYSKTNLTEFYQVYKKGSYHEAQLVLNKIPYDKSFEPIRYFLMGLTYKHLQQHDLAIPNFKKAVKLGNKSGELFFEYGQSLYAVNELEAAKRSFRIAFKKNHKKAYSLYYMAHISDILEDFSDSKINYVKIIRDKKSEKDIKQVAYLKLAEMIYDQTRNKFYAENYIVDYIIPLLKKGVAIEDESDTAKEMLVKYDEILLKHNLHPLLLENGRLLSRQGTNLIFTQEFQIDSNVALESDNPTESNTTTDTSSVATNGQLFYSKRFVGGRHFVFTPEVQIDFIHYFNRENSEVFQNDSYSIAPALRGSYNFSWNKKRAEILYEFDYNYTARDVYEIEKRKFYGRATTFSLGLRRKFFSNEGDTTFKLSKRTLTSYFEDLSGDTSSLYVDQLWIRENGHIFVGVAIADLYRPENDFYATNSLLLRGDYLMPRSLFGLDVTLSGSLYALDTKEQSDDRGTEKLLTLEGRFQKRWSETTRYGLSFSYSKNSSENEEDYAYSRMLWAFNLRYSFN